MQKKVLLSLLATVPVAFTANAYADVTFDDLLQLKEGGDNWNFGGITELAFGTDRVTVKQPGSEATVNIVDVWGKKGVLPSGKYRLTFATLETAVVTINDKAYTPGAEYEYKTGDPFVVKIKGSINAHQYVFGGAKITLNYDFKAAQTHFDKELNRISSKLNLISLELQNPQNPEYESEVYQDLKTRLDKTLPAEIDRIHTMIDGINHETGSNLESYHLNVYNDLELWKAYDETVPGVELKKLEAQIDQLNKEIDAENTRYLNQEENQTRYNDLQKQTDALQAWLDEQAKLYDGNIENGEAGAYQKEQCEDLYNKLVADLADINTEIRTAFFEGNDHIIDNKVVDAAAIDRLINQFNNFKDAYLQRYEEAGKDIKAYNAWYNGRTAFGEYKDKLIADLTAESAKHDEGATYKDIVDEFTATVNTLYNGILNQLSIKEDEVPGADSKLKADQELIANSKTIMQDLFDGNINLINDQEAAKEVADKAVESAKEEVNIITVPEGLVATETTKSTEQLEAQKQAILDKIEVEEGKIATEYGKHELDASDYDLSFVLDDIKNLNAAITNAVMTNENIVANNKLTAELDSLYEALRNHINNELFPAATDDKAAHPLNGKFESTLGNILQSINDFKEDIEIANGKGETLPATDNQYNDIKSNIELTQKVADEIAVAYNKADDILKAWQTKYDEEKEILEARKAEIIPVKDASGNVIEPTLEPASPEAAIADFNKLIEDFTGRFAALPSNDNQALKEAIESITKEIEEKDNSYDADIEKAAYEYAKAVSEYNLGVTESAYNAAKALADELAQKWPVSANENNYPGKAELEQTLNELKEEIDVQRRLIEFGSGTATAPEDATMQELSGANVALRNLFDQIGGVSEAASTYKANNEAHDVILGLEASVESLLENAANEIGDKTTEPARSYYLGKLSELRNQYDDAKAQGETDWNAFKSVEDPEGVKAKLEGLQGSIPALVNAAYANEADHNAQLKALEGLDKFIEDIKVKIENKDLIPNDKQKYLDRINEADTTDALESDIKNSFAEGTSSINNDDLLAAIDNVRSAVKGIFDELLNNYQKDVEDYNENFLGDKELGNPAMTWNQWIDYLRAQYAVAVATFNEYNKITNAGYKEFVGDKIYSHQGIFNYSTPIEELIATVANEVLALSSPEEGQEPIVITAEWLTEHAIKRAEDIISEMNGEVTAMTTVANELAQQYYDAHWAEASGMLADVYQMMLDNGISQEVADADESLKAENEKLTNATTTFGAGKDLGKPSVYMSSHKVKGEDGTETIVPGAADYLDQISMANIDLQKAAKTQWTADYTDAVTKFNGYKAALDSVYTNLSPVQKADYKAQLQNKIDNAQLLNETANAEDTDVFGNLVEFQNRLKSLLDDAKDIDIKANAQNEANIAEDEAYNEFQTAISGDNGLEAAFEALQAWDNDMAVEHLQDYSEIAAAIQEVKALVDENRGKLAADDVQTLINGRIGYVNILIANAYTKCYGDEKAALKSLRDEANRDYNDAFAGGDNSEGERAELRTQLDELGAAVEALADGMGTADKAVVRDELLRIQNALCDIISRIAAEAHKANPADALMVEVNNAYDEVKAQLDALNAQLADTYDEVKDQYGVKVTAQAEDLANIKAGIDRAGNNILATANNFKAALNALSDVMDNLSTAISEKQAEVQAEKDRQAASDARAAELQSQLDGLRAQVDAFKAFVEGSAFYTEKGQEGETKANYEGIVAELEGELANMQAWLTAQKEAYGLTAESVITEAEAFSAKLTNYTDIFATAESDYIISRTSDKYNEVAAVINGTVHNNQAELEASLTELDGRIKALMPSVTIEGVAQLRETINEIMADLEALKENAKANEFIAGNIDGDPDGNVDASDLNALLQFIAQGSEAAPTDAQIKAGDFNNNGRLDIGDASSLIDLILGSDDPAEALAKKYANYQTPVGMTALISGVEIANENGVRTIAIELQNSGEFIGGEFGIKLPAGMQILSEGFGERAEGMAAATADLSDGTHRVAFISTDEKAIEGSEGALYIIEVTGSGNVTIDSPIFTDRYGNLCYGSDPNTTGIGSIYDNLKDRASRVYDAAGRLMNKMQRGINIIVNGKGKGSKVLKK